MAFTGALMINARFSMTRGVAESGNTRTLGPTSSGCRAESTPLAEFVFMGKRTRVPDQIDASPAAQDAERMVLHARTAANVAEHEDLDGLLGWGGRGFVAGWDEGWEAREEEDCCAGDEADEQGGEKGEDLHFGWCWGLEVGDGPGRVCDAQVGRLDGFGGGEVVKRYFGVDGSHRCATVAVPGLLEEVIPGDFGLGLASC